MALPLIDSPDSPALADLCDKLAALAPQLDETGQWPAEQLRLCAAAGVLRWFSQPEWGGLGWDEESVIRGYIELASACLTTTFVLTQRQGACRRIERSENSSLKQRLLPPLAAGEIHATVGISHLTTSRRHLAKPVLSARRAAGGFVLDGYSPWVTGAGHADFVVVAATLVEDAAVTAQQLLAVVPTDAPGATAAPPSQLVALTASRTGQFQCDALFVADEMVLTGPAENVMSQGIGGAAGGVQPSSLALGLSRGAINFLADEARQRPDLLDPLAALRADWDRQAAALFAAVRGVPHCTTDVLRHEANNLALRSTQAALAAAKGAGYVAGHPAGRWCREALFFLVWSCPQPVVSAHLCELAGILE